MFFRRAGDGLTQGLLTFFPLKAGSMPLCRAVFSMKGQHAPLSGKNFANFVSFFCQYWPVGGL